MKLLCMTKKLPVSRKLVTMTDSLSCTTAKPAPSHRRHSRKESMAGRQVGEEGHTEKCGGKEKRANLGRMDALGE